MSMRSIAIVHEARGPSVHVARSGTTCTHRCKHRHGETHLDHQLHFEFLCSQRTCGSRRALHDPQPPAWRHGDWFNLILSPEAIVLMCMAASVAFEHILMGNHGVHCWRRPCRDVTKRIRCTNCLCQFTSKTSVRSMIGVSPDPIWMSFGVRSITLSCTDKLHASQFINTTRAQSGTVVVRRDRNRELHGHIFLPRA